MANAICEYYDKIKTGEIVAGRWILLWYEHVVQGIESGAFTFDESAANHVIDFCEKYCRHHEGALAPQLIKLELWQKAFLSVVFGIKDKDGDRQFREVVLVMGRKNGKTLLAAAIANYCAYKDGEYGGRIYMAAPKLQQANLCYDAFYQMVKKEPALDKRAKKRRTDVYIEASNTSVAPLAFNFRKSDGLNISLCIADEVASWHGEAGLKFYEVLRSSFGSRRQPLLLNITTAGYENDSTYDELIKRCTKVLLGDSGEERLAPFLYMIDDYAKWNQIEELHKANPNLGVSIKESYLAEEIKIAEGSLSKRAEFITKYANLKQSSSQAWLPTRVVDAASCDHLDPNDFRHSYCVCGIDLSQTTDLTSCCLVVEKNEKLYVFSQFFMPQERVDDATAADGVPYRIFAQQGILTLSGDNFVDYHDCYNWIMKMSREYELLPLVIGYDRYSAQYLVKDLEGAGFKTDDVYQGYNLTPVIREFEGMIKDGLICIGDNNLLKSHLLNVSLKADNETQKVKMIKSGNRTRIDGAAALMDAMCVRQKYYADIGELLKNKR